MKYIRLDDDTDLEQSIPCSVCNLPHRLGYYPSKKKPSGTVYKNPTCFHCLNEKYGTYGKTQRWAKANKEKVRAYQNTPEQKAYHKEYSKRYQAARRAAMRAAKQEG